MAKRKSPETGKPEKNARLLELAARLDAIMGGPGSAAEFVLFRAVRAEEAVRALLGEPKSWPLVDAAAALEHDLGNIWSPSVLISLWFDGNAREGPSIVSRPDGTLKVTPDKAARCRIARVQKALTRLPKRVTDGQRMLAAEALAREVALTADEIADRMGGAADSYSRTEPMRRARARVAKAHGIKSGGALKQRIDRARKAHPERDWPKKKARRS